MVTLKSNTCYAAVCTNLSRWRVLNAPPCILPKIGYHRNKSRSVRQVSKWVVIRKFEKHCTNLRDYTIPIIVYRIISSLANRYSQSHHIEASNIYRNCIETETIEQSVFVYDENDEATICPLLLQRETPFTYYFHNIAGVLLTKSCLRSQRCFPESNWT